MCDAAEQHQDLARSDVLSDRPLVPGLVQQHLETRDE